MEDYSIGAVNRSIAFQIRLTLKFTSMLTNVTNQFDNVISEWTIFVHERDQIAWDYSNLFGSNYLTFYDGYIPIYNESYSVFTPHTMVYTDVTLLNKLDRPCTDDPG